MTKLPGRPCKFCGEEIPEGYADVGYGAIWKCKKCGGRYEETEPNYEGRWIPKVELMSRGEMLNRLEKFKTTSEWNRQKYAVLLSVEKWDRIIAYLCGIDLDAKYSTFQIQNVVDNFSGVTCALCELQSCSTCPIVNKYNDTCSDIGFNEIQNFTKQKLDSEKLADLIHACTQFRDKIKSTLEPASKKIHEDCPFQIRKKGGTPDIDRCLYCEFLVFRDEMNEFKEKVQCFSNGFYVDLDKISKKESRNLEESLNILEGVIGPIDIQDSFPLKVPDHVITFETYEDLPSESKEYRKTKTIEAVQLNLEFWVKTKEGVVKGKAGDWLVKGISGELYPIDNKIFNDSYEEV